jgi:two-component system response regulator ChvI
MLIHSSVKVRIELRMGRCRVFKDKSAPNIAHVSLTILYVEDHRLVAAAVQDTLEAEGWRVVGCADGAVATYRLNSPAHYDLMITDNRLPRVGGLELVRYVRVLGRRRGMPVIMLSAEDCEAEARRVGVDVFLKKPEGIAQLVETVRGLIER